MTRFYQTRKIGKLLKGALLFLLLGAAGTVNAQTFTVDNLNYSVNADWQSVTVTGHVDGTNASGELLIPDSVLYLGNYYSVTAIGDVAFSQCGGFSGSLIIPNSVTTIGNNAFEDCYGFSGSLTIGNSVTTIGNNAFEDCYGFSGSLTIGNSVTSIGNNAFDYCTGFTGSLVIPNNVTMIGSWAFMDCTHFSSVYAYATTPPGLGYGVFVGWATTTPVYVPCGAGTAYSTISWGEFDAFTEVCFDDGVLTYSFNSDGQSVTVTGHVDGQNASGYLTIPESVNYLGTEYTVTAIGESAFESCAGFDGSLSIPDAVTTIGSNAFKSCTGFTGSLTLGSSLTTIGDHAFHDCVGFSGSLNLPNTVTSIGDHAFHGCSGFTGDLTLPNSVTTIGANAFYYCYGFNGSLTIGDAVETIGDHAFWNCYNLSGNLTLPSTLTSIGNYTFYQCYSFSGSLTLPDSVEKIGDYAFCFCVNLSGSLTFPSAVDTIGEYAFYFCTNLGSIWMLGTTPPSSVGNNAFAECSSNLKIYVPCGAGEAYSSISWGGFNEFRETCPPFSILPDTLDLGYRPAGKWMRPYQFTLTNDDSEAQITGLQLSGTALSLELGDLTVPFTMYENDSITLGLAWGNQPASVNDTLTVSFTNADGAGSLAFPVFAEVYTPALGDVWENPKVVDGFPYNETLNALSIPLYDNYMLPNPDTLDGNDVVYRLVFDQETMLSAHVTAGANGKVAFYDEDFNGLGGPDEKNVFGNSDPFEAEIGEGGNYTYYFPFYSLYIHSIAESLFLASELDSAGVTTAPMTSLSWYCNYTSGYPQHGLSIWMANVTDRELDTVSHVATDMTLVYTGDMTPAIGWNEIVFNQGTFAWDGVSNVLILFHRDNGEWSSNSVEWRAQRLGFNAMSYNYRDYEAFDVTVPNTMTPKTIRPDIIMKADGQHGPLVNQVEFDSLYVPAGTYYAVFSSTDDAFTVEMTTDSVPLPEPAVIVSPTQGETYVTTPYQAKWIIGQYTNEIQVLFGTQNPPTTVLLDWTDQLVNRCSLPDMLHNQGYYLQVNERNASGVTNSAVTAFSSYLDPPVDLHALGSTVILEGGAVQLAWSAPNDGRALLRYNIYKDNVLVGDTTATQYTISGFSYTGNPTIINVTAVYDEGESNKSNDLSVCVNGLGSVAGHVYEQDGITPIANATVTIYGIDHFSNDYGTSFVTGADGSYSGAVLAGNYYAHASAPGYSEATRPYLFVVNYGVCTTGIDVVLDEYFYPPTQVAADYAPNPDNYESDTVQVTWAAPTGDRSLQKYHVYRTTYDNNGPYNSGNTIMLADNVTRLEFTDPTFGDLEDGLYKYGVSAVYAGNRADEPEPILDENFDNGLPEGWTTIDADGDGFNWILGSAAGGVYLGQDINLAGEGHNGSADMMVSGSYSNCFSQALAPDNYLVTPQVELGGIFSFWACAQDYMYPGEHFGVAISTTGNSNANDFTTIQGWTVTCSGSRSQTNWYQYSVDLRDYAGQTGYIAIRHFNCYDQFILDVDDVYYVIYQLYPGARESQIAWTNIDHGQYLYDAVSLTVTLNTNDNLEGTQVWLTQSPEQQEWNKMDSTQLNFYLDETGTHTWNRFRKGTYGIHIAKPGYDTIVDMVSITDTTALAYEMVETIEKPTNFYVSRTGWATWDNVANGQRHYIETLLTLTNLYGDTISSCTTDKNYMQLPTASLTDGELYRCTVAYCYSSGVGSVTQLWLYQSCDHFEGTTEQTGTVDEAGVHLSWTYPEPDTTGTRTVNNYGTWYYYDNGTLEDHIGKPGGTFYWGIMIPAGSYDGNLITSVIAYDIEPMTGTLTIYNDGETAPADSVAQFNVTFTGAGEFVTIGMNPVEINPNKNIWLVFYNASGANYPAAASYDTGDPNGRWLNENENGTTWADILSSPYNFHLTWMIRAQIVSTVPTPVGDYLGAAVFRDGEWIGFTSGTSFLDAEGTRDNEYALRVVYNGDSICPNANAYFAMSCPQTVAFPIPQYVITATANPTAGGSVSGGGTYNHGATCTLSAVANAGYTFVNWTKNGTVVSNEASYSFSVVDNGNYVANFQFSLPALSIQPDTLDLGYRPAGAWMRPYQFTLTSNNAQTTISMMDFSPNGLLSLDMGELDFPFVLEQNESATLGIDWGDQPGSMDGSLAVFYSSAEATRSAAVFPVEAEIYSPALGDVWENPKVVDGFPYNETLNATTIPLFNNYVLPDANLSDGNDVVYQLTFDHDVLLSAHVTGDNGKLALYAEGFQGLGGPDEDNTYADSTSYIPMTADTYYLVASSTSDTFSISIDTMLFPYPPTNLSSLEKGVLCDGNDLHLIWDEPEGDNPVTLYKIYKWDEWSQDFHFHGNADTEEYGQAGLVYGDDGSAYTSYYYKVSAWYEADSLESALTDAYEVRVYPQGTVNGHVYKQDSVTSVAGATVHFKVGERVFNGTTDTNGAYTVTLPATSYDFGKAWATAAFHDSAFYPESLTLLPSGVLNNVDFILQSLEYQITASANPTAGGSISGSGTYYHGSTCTLSATANEGYTFVNWTKGTEVVSTSPSFSFSVTQDSSFVANFNLNSYEVMAAANPSEGGSVSGAGTYYHGSTCTLSATANEGYTFVNWTKGTEVVSTSPSFSFTVTQDSSFVANFNLNSYEIAASANPSAGGSVSGGGTYNHGATCTLTATANEGYTFVNWTKGTEVVSTSPSFSFNVTQDSSFVANFNLNSYEITVAANPTAGGSVSGAGTYNHFDNCTLTATAAIGYHFLNWTLNGNVVSTSPIYQFEVTGAAAYVAHFEINSYEITATANPSEGGSVSGAGTYNHFDNCTLTATVANGYHFLKWTLNGNVVSTSPTYQFEVTGAAAYVAHFEINSYAIAVSANPTAGGIVTGAGTYNHGSVCTLTATARMGYSFVNWTRDGEVVSTDATYSFTVTEAASFVAHFYHLNYEITASASPAEGGSVSGAGTYYYGTTCTLTATANAGYYFTHWTKNGVTVPGGPSIHFAVTEGASYMAHFSHNMYMITVSADPTEGGSVWGNGAFLYGENCTVTAVANAGYTFTNWTLNGAVVSSEVSYTFTVTQSANLVAHFSLDHYFVTVSAAPEAGGSATGGGSFTYGETCTLSAVPNTGYSFVNWTKNGTVVSTSSNYSFTVTGNGNYVANFAFSRHTITVVADPTEGGSVHGGGTFDYGHLTTLRAIVNEGFVFVNWTKDGSVVSTNPIHSIIVREDAEYVAHFRAFPYEVGEQNGISVSLFPNPAGSNITVETSEPIRLLEVFNIDGALICRLKDCSDRVVIDVASLASGIYMIRLTTDSAIESRRFVKQ